MEAMDFEDEYEEIQTDNDILNNLGTLYPIFETDEENVSSEKVCGQSL